MEASCPRGGAGIHGRRKIFAKTLFIPLLAVDTSVFTTMKNAANSDKYFKLKDFVHD